MMELPSTKVTTFTVAAALAAIVCWLVETIWHLDVPGTIQTAIAIVVGFILAHQVSETRPSSSARRHIRDESKNA